MSLSTGLIKSLMAERTDTVLNTLITIDFKNGTIWHICDGFSNISYKGNLYLASAFTFDPPDTQRDTAAEASLSISCIDQSLPEIAGSIDDALQPTIVAHTLFNPATGDAEEGDYWSFQLSGCDWDAVHFTAKLVFGACLLQVVPCRRFDSIYCPGAFA